MEYDGCNGNDPCNSFRHLHSNRNGWQWMQLSHLTGSNSKSFADSNETEARTSSAWRKSACDGSCPERQAKLTAMPAREMPGRPVSWPRPPPRPPAGRPHGGRRGRRSGGPRSAWGVRPPARGAECARRLRVREEDSSATAAAVCSSSLCGARMSVRGPSPPAASLSRDSRRESARPSAPPSSIARPTAGSPSTAFVTPSSEKPAASSCAFSRRVAS